MMISIAITYNGGQFLEEQLLSIGNRENFFSRGRTAEAFANCE
jgi:hypothetical protein